jgi:hypothetical protein
MSSITEAYEIEFKALEDEIKKAMASYSSNNERSKVASLSRQVEALFGQGTDLAKQMEVEVRSLSGSERRASNEIVSNWKRSLTASKANFQKMKSSSKAQREEDRMELGMAGSSSSGKSTEQRQRLLSANERLSNTSDTLHGAQRTAAEAEEVGIEITQELARNRERLVSAQSKVEFILRS